MNDVPSPVLLLPGWQNSGASHWQTLWEQRYGYTRVEQDDWQWPRRGDWMARLEEVLLAAEGPCWLVAHSLGCQLVAAWAAHTRHGDRVRGALLVAPPDPEREDVPAQLHAWRPVPRQRLPFRATMVISADDPYCTPQRAGAMAQDWGATLVMAGALGHLNGESRLGDWDDGHLLLTALRSA